MYKIHLDATERKTISVKLFSDEGEVDEITGDVDLVSAIREILGRNSLKISNVGNFSMNEGPGSFTGLKISASIVNALNWAVCGKPPKDVVIPRYSPSKFD